MMALVTLNLVFSLECVLMLIAYTARAWISQPSLVIDLAVTLVFLGAYLCDLINHGSFTV